MRFVWGGQNSVYNALKKDNNYVIYTFDVTSPTRKKHLVIDLAQENIVNVFNKKIKSGEIKKPDIIISSTLCQSFSSITSMRKDENGNKGTSGWIFKEYDEKGRKLSKPKFILRDEKSFEKLKSGFTKHLKWKTQNFIAKLGSQCIKNTIELIKYFKPKYWYIENPNTSRLWQYIEYCTDFFNYLKKNNMSYFFNKATYGKYGYPTAKYTYFLSNVKCEKPCLLFGTIEKPWYWSNDENGKKCMRLKATNRIIKSRIAAFGYFTKSGKQKEKISNYQTCEAGNNSLIPKKLINDIFLNFKF